ncbi:hypothetical protein FisN_6Lh435 [Fistulifera solaris]|uniref:Uncharacterized protein n=1 Tax=Fistulifera solaris TaxID=1519565 RepID=A0A1Z5JKV6_FISSO|nr:hypothetical protein FisN_6Lh435 [Fistulifera solaris]|eukprot:GAX14650.1 hypothetical protein FisN_6Lh435 [Fistulifera solaris]
MSNMSNMTAHTNDLPLSMRADKHRVSFDPVAIVASNVMGEGPRTPNPTMYYNSKVRTTNRTPPDYYHCDQVFGKHHLLLEESSL